MSFSQDLITKYPSLVKFDWDNYAESHDGRETALLKYIYNHASLDQLRGSPSAILAVIDEFAAQQDFLINIGSDKAAKVCEIIKQDRPSVLVELGGYIGYSAICFGQAMREAASPGQSVQLLSLEFDPLIAAIAMSLVDLAGLSDVVKVVVGSAADSLKRLHSEGHLNHIDLLFLDHVEDLYISDYQVCEELGLLQSGALVIADNVLRPGAPQYREFIRASPRVESWAVKGLIIPGELEVSILDFGQSIAPDNSVIQSLTSGI